MTEPLNYRASNSAVYYTPPKKIDVARTIVTSLIVALLAIAGAVAYAKIQPNLESFVLRIVEVIFAALATGVLGIFVVVRGRVRLPLVAASIGALLGLLVIYVIWLTWAVTLFQHFKYPLTYWMMIRNPGRLFRLIRTLSKVGTWRYGGDVIAGPSLIFFWLSEAGAILAGAVLMPLKGIGNDDPLCRSCGSKCRSVGRLPRFAPDQKDAFVTAVESRDFASLASFASSTDEDAPELSMRLLSCPKCGETNVFSVSRIAWGRDKNGRTKVVSEPLVKELLVTREEAEQIKASKNSSPQPS